VHVCVCEREKDIERERLRVCELSFLPRISQNRGGVSPLLIEESRRPPLLVFS